jgi:hypothetical protein
MKGWLALILGPSIALGVQSALYAMVTPSCATQTRLELHLAAAVGLVIVLVLAVLAYGESSLSRREPGTADSDEAHPPAPRRFLASVGAAVAGLSALVIVAMWFALWILSPCMP